MKQFFAGVFVLTFLVACQNKKANIDPFASLTSEVDSARCMVDSLSKDSLSKELNPIEEDDSFDDFVFRFATDDKLQRQRIAFPLPYYNEGKKLSVEKRYWKHDDLFVKQGYYTLIFESEEEMNLAEDLEVNAVKIEFVYLKTRMMKTYSFERKKKIWMLNQIDLSELKVNNEEDFIDFFGRFAADSLFQSQRIKKPLAFVTTDPDDDFSVIETTLDLNQWYAFKPKLPTDCLFNVNYGQNSNTDSSTKIIALKGVGNGFSNVLYFQRREKQWELCKFEDTSI